jgi:flagellar biosynthesis/type III secretory pathway M-ring protein FliF/YscJ
MKRIIPVIVILVLLAVFARLIHSYFPSLDNQSIRVLFFAGLFVLLLLVCVVFWLQTKLLKKKMAKAMKEALEREAREGKTIDEEDDTTV